MPSESRNTVRRNFSINQEASQAIDSFADEHNLTKSKVVERAVMEHTSKDRTARIERKVDEILASLDGGNAPLAQTGGKKKNSHNSSTDFDPAGYNPDEDRDEPLSKDELKELITIDEPVVNPAHIDENNLPGSTREKTTLMAAIVRFNVKERNSHTFGPGWVRGVIKDHLGDSDYLLNQYTDPVKDEFETGRTIVFNRDEERYEVDTTGLFPTESRRQQYYQERYEAIQEAIDTPIDEMPEFDVGPKPYEFLRQWLDDFRINKILQELDIATSDEIDDLKEELTTYRDDIDECLTAIEETSRRNNFTQQEAIEAVPYDEEQSESIVSLLRETGYIGDWKDSFKDMGISKDRIVWRD